MKPLGRKAYGSIPHIPGSNRPKGDTGFLTNGQSDILTVKSRKGDLIIVQEKLDGACVSVARIDGKLHPLVRAGYLALSSQHKFLHEFHDWVHLYKDRFDFLEEGERVVGEWLLKVHSTRYTIERHMDLFRPFDIMVDSKRVRFLDLLEKLEGNLKLPTLIHFGDPLLPEIAMQYAFAKSSSDEPEGVVYRVERFGEVDFLGKYVRPGFTPGLLLQSEERNWYG